MSNIFFSSPVRFAFDIGHASIGWAVTRTVKKPGMQEPEIVDAGVVIFPSDDCLASARRAHRRMRRNIRATRQRVERLKRLFVAKGILTREELDLPGHPAPFFLAARYFEHGRLLNALEFWNVIRWYAHNRGYDGNVGWSGQEDNPDTERLLKAQELMRDRNCSTMAETLCRIMKLDTRYTEAPFRSDTPPYKTTNAAYPRKIVEEEVSRLFRAHLHHLPGVDDEMVTFCMAKHQLGKDERKKLTESGILRLPRRYFGGLLFGQLMPRFDNRIIRSCPITWAQTYGMALKEKLPDADARKKADKLSKVPSAFCHEFLQYRFARVLVNIRVNGEPLDMGMRMFLFKRAMQKGALKKADIEKLIQEKYGADTSSNIRNYFHLHPDSEEALVLDPAQAEAWEAEHSSRHFLHRFWKHFSEALKKRIVSMWKKRKGVSLLECRNLIVRHGGDTRGVDKEVAMLLQDESRKKKPAFYDESSILNKRILPKFPSGRAPYARKVMEQVVQEFLSGFDSSRPACSEYQPSGEKKSRDGVLYCLLNPSSFENQMEQARPIDSLTNNHLVRHRLLILSRLVGEMIQEYAHGRDHDVEEVIVEMGRDVSFFSGMTDKEIQAELNGRLTHFKKAVDYLKKHAPDLPVTGGLIRKCRIAMDLNWQCPFTGKSYDAYDLPKLEKEHIIPYAHVQTNALHALVLTLPEVNKMKDKRTAWQFIQEDQNRKVEGVPSLSIRTSRIFKEWVESLDTRGHFDDIKRKKARKKLLLTEKIEDGNEPHEFTLGQMTRSSQVMKLAAKILRQRLPQATISHIPGMVTAQIRKSWRLTGCLVRVAPEIANEDGTIKTKDEIRGITHMHHALDALTLALASHYIPGINNGRLWQLLMKRRLKDNELEEIRPYGIFRAGADQSLLLKDIPKVVKNEVAVVLLRSRVMQHLPSDRHGTDAEETTWSIDHIEGKGKSAVVHLTQKTTSVTGGKRKRELKSSVEKAAKLLGVFPSTAHSKLAAIRGAIVIKGNYGIALDPEPQVIPHHQVHQTIRQLQEKNGGAPVRILRKGMLIELSGFRVFERNGIWRIKSTKSNAGGIALNLVRPDLVGNPSKGPKVWNNVLLKSLLKSRLTILPQSYLGRKM